MKEIIAPITKLHPHNITECKKSDIYKLCQVINMDLKDARFTEIQFVRNEIKDANGIQEVSSR